MESTQCESVGPFLCGERSWVVPCRDVRPTPPVFSHTARPRSGPSRAPSPRRYVSHGRREGGNAAARAGLGARGGSVEGGRGEGEPLGAARRWCRRPTWRHPAPIAGPGHASVPPTPLFLSGGAHWPPPAGRRPHDPGPAAFCLSAADDRSTRAGTLPMDVSIFISISSVSRLSRNFEARPLLLVVVCRKLLDKFIANVFMIEQIFKIYACAQIDQDREISRDL